MVCEKTKLFSTLISSNVLVTNKVSHTLVFFMENASHQPTDLRGKSVVLSSHVSAPPVYCSSRALARKLAAGLLPLFSGMIPTPSAPIASLSPSPPLHLLPHGSLERTHMSPRGGGGE
jgi:hypothetical protein